MSDELLDFPDGGRATLTRRYSPTLTRRQLDILAACPYEAPHAIVNRDHPTALALMRAGLLERHPDSIAVFRVTQAGAHVVARWKSAGWLP